MKRVPRLLLGKLPGTSHIKNRANYHSLTSQLPPLRNFLAEPRDHHVLKSQELAFSVSLTCGPFVHLRVALMLSSASAVCPLPAVTATFLGIHFGEAGALYKSMATREQSRPQKGGSLPPSVPSSPSSCRQLPAPCPCPHCTSTSSLTSSGPNPLTPSQLSPACRPSDSCIRVSVDSLSPGDGAFPGTA